MKRSVIIVPGSTDMNRGDQALTWETARIIKEACLSTEIAIIDVGDTPEEREKQSSQSRNEGFVLVSSLLPHPRRGRHAAKDKVSESALSFVLMMLYGIYDFLRSYLILLFVNFPVIEGKLLKKEHYDTYVAFREVDFVVVKGGGFLHAYGGLTDAYYIWYLTFYIRLAHRLRKPVYVMPNSYGPFKGWTVKRQIRYALSRCAFVSARETVSADALEQALGVKVPVFPDLGYFLLASDRRIGERLCHEAGVPLGVQQCVGFTLRPYRFPKSQNPELAYLDYLDAMESLVHHVTSLGLYPVFVTQVSGPSATENDDLAIRELTSRLSSVEFSWIKQPGNCRDVKSVYGCLDYVVGTRFHSVVFAQSEGIPCLAIGYGGNKANGIMGDAQFGDYVVPIEDISGNILCQKFSMLLVNIEDARKRLYDLHVNNQVKRNQLLALLALSSVRQ